MLQAKIRLDPAMSRRQAEEIWESQDKLPRQEFDPRTYFNLHDLNGDGYHDVNEIR